MARKHNTSVYPFWIGLLAFGAVGGYWWADASSESPVAEAPQIAPDAGTPVLAREPGESEHAIDWRIVESTLPAADGLRLCLSQAGFAKVQVKVAGAGLAIVDPALATPISLNTQAADLALHTVITASTRHAAVALHFRVAECLSGQAKALVDVLNMRRWSLDDWPRASPKGGVPIGALVDVEVLGDGLFRSRGLQRMGLKDVLVGGALDDAQPVIERAAALLIAGMALEPEAGRPARLLPLSDAGALWTGPITPGLALLVEGVGAETKRFVPTPTAPPVAQAKPAGPRPRLKTAQRHPKTSRRKPSRRARPKKRPDRKPVFMPDYR